MWKTKLVLWVKNIVQLQQLIWNIGFLAVCYLASINFSHNLEDKIFDDQGNFLACQESVDLVNMIGMSLPKFTIVMPILGMPKSVRLCKTKILSYKEKWLARTCCYDTSEHFRVHMYAYQYLLHVHCK